MSMNIEQYLLTKLAEEASEIAQMALKTQQFGWDEVCPNQPLTNAERLYKELDDLLASIEMLNVVGLCYHPSRKNIDAKKEKVEKYLGYSIDCGTVGKDELQRYEELESTINHNLF